MRRPDDNPRYTLQTNFVPEDPMVNMRRALFARPVEFRGRVRLAVRLAIPWRQEPMTEEAVEALVGTCLMTMLDPHDAERAGRVMEREQPEDLEEAIEALCDWTVRRERARLRRVTRA